jgi:hypothetical protein
MTELPAGTVTFLFTDISTRLLANSATATRARSQTTGGYCAKRSCVTAESEGVEALCVAFAGRELTRREWNDALRERPYRAVCSDG